jgi:hypothetical protein
MLLIARNLLRAEGEMFLKTLGCIKVSAVAGIIFTWARATKQRSVISDQRSAFSTCDSACSGQIASCFAQKENLTTDEHGWHGFANSKRSYLNFFNPCKSVLSVLSVVRFCVFVQSDC